MKTTNLVTHTLEHTGNRLVITDLINHGTLTIRDNAVDGEENPLVDIWNEIVERFKQRKLVLILRGSSTIDLGKGFSLFGSVILEDVYLSGAALQNVMLSSVELHAHYGVHIYMTKLANIKSKKTFNLIDIKFSEMAGEFQGLVDGNNIQYSHNKNHALV